MRILGIDPGIAIVGFGLIEADRGRTQLLNYGAITTPADCRWRAASCRSSRTWKRSSRS